jgi:ankyrin repeat protein
MSTRSKKAAEVKEKKAEEPVVAAKEEEVESGSGTALMVSQLLLLVFAATTIGLVVAIMLPVFKMQPWSNPALAIQLAKTQFLRVIDEKDQFPQLALIEAVRDGNHEAVKALVNEKGVRADWTDEDGYMPAIHVAVDQTDLEMVETILPTLSTPNVRDAIGYPALQWAAYRPWMEGVKALIKAGANPNQGHSQTDMTALHMSASIDFEVSKFLVENGANVNAKSTEGITPLLRALARGQLKTAELLIEKGADTTVIDHFGDNAFLTAASSGSAQTMEFASKLKGVDLKRRNNRGLSAFQIAFFAGGLEAADWLAQNGHIDFSPRPSDNLTPVEFAVQRNYIKGLRLLIDNGADIKTDNAKLVKMANDKEFDEIAEMLATAGFAGIPL